MIGVVNYGLLEKGGSTSSRSFAYKNLEEAQDYQAENGGRLHKITEMEEMEGMGDREKNKCYVLNFKDKAELNNGFRWIKELILQMHNFYMYDAYQKLKENSIEVYSVKTDAFVIDTCNVEKAMKVLDFHNDVGGWRVSKTDNDIIFPTVQYNIVENERIDIPVDECKELHVKDEYATDDIIDNHIIPHNPVIIRGEIAGTGKSFICQRMAERGYKVIFVCPTNKLLQPFEGEATTINYFLE